MKNKLTLVVLGSVLVMSLNAFAATNVVKEKVSTPVMTKVTTKTETVKTNHVKKVKPVNSKTLVKTSVVKTPKMTKTTTMTHKN